MKKSYVYKGKEFVLTGRTAKTKNVTRRKNPEVDRLHEIRPHDADENDKKYNEWVRMKDLYEVEETE